MPSSEPPGAARDKCPICGKATEPDYRPFCSRRCADVDLSRWLRGTYAIPDRSESEDGDEHATGPADAAANGNAESGKE